MMLGGIAACSRRKPLEKCMTFKDIFPGLSRTKVIFRDIPGNLGTPPVTRVVQYCPPQSAY